MPSLDSFDTAIAVVIALVSAKPNRAVNAGSAQEAVENQIAATRVELQKRARRLR